MNIAVKATLFSAIVFPGSGYILLKQRLRAFIFMSTSLVCLATIIKITVAKALTVVAKIQAGDVPINQQAITDLLMNVVNDRDHLAINMATFVIIFCWIVSSIDCYRLGRRHNDNELAKH